LRDRPQGHAPDKSGAKTQRNIVMLIKKTKGNLNQDNPQDVMRSFMHWWV
jgi:hypothetical protein